MRVITPPMVSIPRLNGVTSSRSTSFTSPVNTPPWIAAPTATTSSGLTPFDGALPKNFCTASWIAGIRVEPPTRMISSMSLVVRPAFCRAVRHGAIVRWIRSSISCSNLARVRVLTRCAGTPFTGMMYGRLISVVVVFDSSILAFSAASFRRCIAIGSLLRSAPPFSLLNS